MEGMTIIEAGKILRWAKSGNKWTVKLIKEEANSSSDGKTNLVKETLLKEMDYSD